jgi:glycosyltransferase involved in cell wall biosynthesis
LGHGAYLPPISAKYVVRLSSSAVDVGVAGARYFAALERRSCQKADLIIAHSEAMNGKGLGYYGYPPGKSRVIHLGLSDVAQNGATRPSDRLQLLYLGRAEERKGTDIFLAALLRLLPGHRNVHVRFVGADIDSFVASRPDLATTWQSLKADFGEHLDVVPIVAEEKKNALLSGSHWLVVPSRFESFGLVAVEALRAGTPIVASEVGGLAEIGAKAPGSRTFAAGDDTALCRELADIADRGAQYAESLRAEARRSYERSFTANRMVEESLNAYASLVPEC